MTYRTHNQAGFEMIGIVVALLFVAVVGAVGYKVLNMNKAASTEQSSAISSQNVPATIKTKADLSQTGKALDSSGRQLDSSLNDTSLDTDVHSLL